MKPITMLLFILIIKLDSTEYKLFFMFGETHEDDDFISELISKTTIYEKSKKFRSFPKEKNIALIFFK